MICDFHVHTKFSADSDADIDQVIQAAIQKGMSHLCITDHHDPDYEVEEGLSFLLSPGEYYQTLCEYRKKYQDRIKLLIGVEMGLQPHIKNEVEAFLKNGTFDFVIGSSHVIDGTDPYYPEIWKNKTTEEVMNHYFENIYENIQIHDCFDVYGHIDYAIRYAPHKDKDYCYDKYKEILDKILKAIISKGKGIEINTGGLRKGLHSTNPCEEIILHYKKYGGEIITVGSDAHMSGDVGADFLAAKEILKACGFTHYYIFEERKPVALKL